MIAFTHRTGFAEILRIFPAPAIAAATVGMSTAVETIALRHMGVRARGILKKIHGLENVE